MNTANKAFTSIIIPIELFNYDEILSFYSYMDKNTSVYIMRTNTENVYLVHNAGNGASFSIFGYR